MEKEFTPARKRAAAAAASAASALTKSATPVTNIPYDGDDSIENDILADQLLWAQEMIAANMAVERQMHERERTRLEAKVAKEKEKRKGPPANNEVPLQPVPELNESMLKWMVEKMEKASKKAAAAIEKESGSGSGGAPVPVKRVPYEY